ncbi:hypothetical protein Fmac_020419 [Flemingia macrophylla]|uniref:Uncharacterized protein n=1 Tax=Flemingia macrophylla TaxID=520843 RepID=A0ABD1LTZ4_9FABA
MSSQRFEILSNWFEGFTFENAPSTNPYVPSVAGSLARSLAWYNSDVKHIISTLFHSLPAEIVDREPVLDFHEILTMKGQLFNLNFFNKINTSRAYLISPHLGSHFVICRRGAKVSAGAPECENSMFSITCWRWGTRTGARALEPSDPLVLGQQNWR